MTSPLIRDIPLIPERIASIYWVSACISLGRGMVLYISHATPLNKAHDPDARWHLTCYDQPVRTPHVKVIGQHSGLSEFEAQAVLDHYIQTYGLPSEVT